MRQKIGIISALSASTLPFIDEAYASIQALQVPEGYELEWYIQHDGDSDAIVRPYFADKTVHYQHSGRHLGAAATRNQALLRADTQFILSCDSDDILEPTALCELTKGFAHDDVAWSAGAWHELHADGKITAWRSPLFEGVRAQHWIYDEIMRLNKTPFSMNPVLYRRDVVLAAGGWPAFPEWEDTLLLTVISGHYSGWATTARVGLYRRHEQSYSLSDTFQKSKPIMYAYIKSVGAALKKQFPIEQHGIL